MWREYKILRKRKQKGKFYTKSVFPFSLLLFEDSWIFILTRISLVRSCFDTLLGARKWRILCHFSARYIKGNTYSNTFPFFCSLTKYTTAWEWRGNHTPEIKVIYYTVYVHFTIETTVISYPSHSTMDVARYQLHSFHIELTWLWLFCVHVLAWHDATWHNMKLM